MGTKNVRKTKSHVTKEKILKSAKGLQRNFRKCILKNSQFFCEYPEIKAETKKNAKGKSWSVRGLLSHLKIFTLKMRTPFILIKYAHIFCYQIFFL